MGKEANGLDVQRAFHGVLSKDSNKAEVVVKINTDPRGELVFSFEPIAFSEETRFLCDPWRKSKSGTLAFSLIGQAEDGTEFETTTFHVSGAHFYSHDDIPWFDVTGECLEATIRRPWLDADDSATFSMRLCGFENFRNEETSCDLGTVMMAGSTKVTDHGLLSGGLFIRVAPAPADTAGWRADAEKLLEHVRRVMSMARAMLLPCPALEFYGAGVVEVVIRSQTQRSSALPVVRSLTQSDLFVAAVASYFKAPITALRFHHAIEWFCMSGTYNEMRLICAMTSLENLIEWNLEPEQKRVQSKAKFKKTAERLANALNNERADDAQELREKLGDLNRRSLIRKIYVLARRWNVPLDGLDKVAIRDAVNARNSVVHRGIYYDDRDEQLPDLWTHVCVIRELVVRVFFTVIGYRGPYISYIGAAHDARFPPSSPEARIAAT